MFEYVRADIKRKFKMYLREKTLMGRLRLIAQFGTIAVVVYRFGSWAYKLKIPVVREILFSVYSVLKLVVMVCAGINIQTKAEIGKGFIIHNFSGIFVGATKIGDNCVINQGVTVGNIRGTEHRPLIGNNVYLGTGCTVLGPVKIGDNVMIGANSLVIEPVPDNCTVMGVPTKIVSRIVTSPYLKFTEY
ncbi:MAG: DapH/DapD/GlmU-related protein [Nitrospiraceae bacterium]|nr:DapH/DapD/GlmU-related protein [Nitrospiraceae bacterium]